MPYPAPYSIENVTSGYRPPHRPDHVGKDMVKGKGTKIYPARAGKVIALHEGAVEGDTSAGGGYGNHVIIDCGNGITVLYGHLSKVNVKIGQRVTRNTVIGEEGNTGYSFGSHLHFEVRKNGVPIDPTELLESSDDFIYSFVTNKYVIGLCVVIAIIIIFKPFKKLKKWI